MTPYVLVAADRLADVAAGSVVALDDDTHHHLVRVRRQRDGDDVTASDGRGREVAATLSGRTLVVQDVRDLPAPVPTIEVLQGLGRQRKHDDVVRMLTEAGADAITAVTTSRTQVDLAGKADRVRARWQAVADAACSQSRRAHRPLVEGPVGLADLVVSGLDDARILVADPGAHVSPLQALGDVHDLPGRVVCVIGPEGGLTDAELADLQDAGAVGVSLGPTVLRTQHAALALAAVVAAAVGRMGQVG